MKKYLLIFSLFIIFSSFVFAKKQTKVDETLLLRFPDIHKNKIVFVYAGDLWTVGTEGGLAKRITSNTDINIFPRFSPDGKWIAYTGTYNGNRDVHIIPFQGGEPQKLTYRGNNCPAGERHGFDDQVVDWHPDGKKILFRSKRTTPQDWYAKYFYAKLDGSLPDELVLPMGGMASFSPDGKKIAYNRIFRDFRTWKRYRGGLAQDVWVYDFKKNKIEQITKDPATDNNPMWHSNKIYFTSDRDKNKRFNIFCYDLKTKKLEQITRHTEFDVKWPSIGKNFIVYEMRGALYVLDLKTHKYKKLLIKVPAEKKHVKPKFVNLKNRITYFDLGRTGKRALITARGDIFTAPAEKGEVREIITTSESNEKYAGWSPDGKWIAYISDATGEDEVYIVDGKGEKKPIQITKNSKATKFAPTWSPDSKNLVFADKNLKLFYVNIDSKKVTFIDKATKGEIKHYSWSPDSKWISYTKPHETDFHSVYLYSLDTKKITQVTTELTYDKNPVFSKDGKYLFFISERDYNAIADTTDLNFIYQHISKIYVVTLAKDTPSPFAPESDEEEIKKEDKKKKDKDEEKEEKVVVKIDLAGIGDRIVAAPTAPGNYFGLLVAKNKFVYLHIPTWIFYEGDEEEPKGSLHLFDLEKRKDHTIVDELDSYAMSNNGEKLLIKKDSKFYVIDAKPDKQELGENELKLKGFKTKVDPKKEWVQMFNEAWRMQRDYFYDPKMHGVDWLKIKADYEKLLAHVAHRVDLTYLMGEMMSELNCSHTYVGSGDYPKDSGVNVGVLGVDFKVGKKNFYKFAKIYPGENWKDEMRSPLTEPGLNVKKGDYLIAVNGKIVKAPANPYEFFENTTGKIVELTINRKPSTNKARKILVKPTSSDYLLRHWDWINTNRTKVDKATKGKVGYVYIPDMSNAGLAAFTKQYYGQIRKEGLIIDVRFNGGGFVSQVIIERLRRVIKNMGAPRNASPYTYPYTAFYGHMVCVTNRFSASDGDVFPHAFREYGLGPIIGQRTWGGVVGIRGYYRLIDGGYITMPEFAKFDMEGKWVLENYGVDPDIEVDNRPDLVVAGRDPQLEKAIEVVMKKIKEEPKKLPTRPKSPDDKR